MNLNRIDECKSKEEALKIVYMWVKQAHIGQKEFLGLVNHINMTFI